jgi:hypothetical protein
MAETEPGRRPDERVFGNSGDEGRRQPAMCLSHHPRGEELSINHLGWRDLGEPAEPEPDPAL